MMAVSFCGVLLYARGANNPLLLEKTPHGSVANAVQLKPERGIAAHASWSVKDVSVPASFRAASG
jgi:hypothetical protein